MVITLTPGHQGAQSLLIVKTSSKTLTCSQTSISSVPIKAEILKISDIKLKAFPSAPLLKDTGMVLLFVGGGGGNGVCVCVCVF